MRYFLCEFCFCCSASFAALLTTFAALCAKYSVQFSPRLTIILMLFGFSALLLVLVVL